MILSEKESTALSRIKEFEETVDPSTWRIGWEWSQVSVQPAIINNLITKGMVELTYSSNKHKAYKLTDKGKAHVEDEETYIDQEPATELDFSTCFGNIVGHNNIKELLTTSLQLEKPIHVLMYGPPAVSKSLFMWEIERIAGSQALWLMGSGTSKAGLWDMIAQTKPRIILIDELEKMKPEDMSGLLGLMEKGRITRTKKGGSFDVTINAWVIATANRIDRLPQELKSRFAIQRMDEYSAKEFVQVVQSVVHAYEGMTENEAYALSMKLVGRTHDVRDAIRAARLAKVSGVDRAVELLFKG